MATKLITLDQNEVTFDKVVQVNRVAKVVKGGRRFSFSALVVVGNQNGLVGVGLGKATEVPDAIKKASKQARKNIVHVPRKGNTIPHPVKGRFGAGHVILKPAQEGTGVIASALVRSMAEAAGVLNMVAKSVGSNNAHNVIKATIDGFKQFDISMADRLSEKVRGGEL